MTETSTPEREADPGTSRWSSPAVAVSVGIAAAVLGLLPWILTGLRLPLQNLWATEPGRDGMPIALLPFSQYYITLIPGLIVTGSAIAGIVARATRGSRSARMALAGGVLGTHVIAAAQTTIVVNSGLQERAEATMYLALLVAVTVLSVLLGLLVLWLVASTPAAGAGIGLVLAAVVLEPWLRALFFPNVVWTDGPLTSVLSWAPLWIPALLVGAAIAWMGLATTGRRLTALAGLLLVWIGPVALRAAEAAAGTRVLARDPAGMLEYGLGLFRDMLFASEFPLRVALLAVATAAIGLAMRWALRRRRTTATT